MIGVLQTIEAFIGNANQLVRLLAVLREGGHTMVHANAHAQLQRLEHFEKNRFHTAAKR
jgi:hypothetical protein